MSKEKSATTRTVRASVGVDKAYGAVMPPLYLSSTYSFEGYDKKRRYDYARTANPTRDALGEALADLEGGAGATVTASGMAAVHLITHLLEPGDVLIAPHDCYGGTYRLLEALHAKGHFEVRFMDQTDSCAIGRALADRPRMVLIETPSNPLLRIVDIGSICRLARQTGTLVATDNTFLSPVLQKPLELGADLVVHSTTKYLNGHSDVVGGAVIARTPELHQRLAWWANCIGNTGAPFDSHLTLRGLRTLHARMRLHEENAARLVDVLETHEGVSRVYYPGLDSHPGHAIAKRQQKGFGGMLSFDVAGGVVQLRAFLSSLECFGLAESLGGVESLVAHPATMTHAAMEPQARERAGIGDTLVRLSVGIEDGEDLVADVRQALDRAAETAQSSYADTRQRLA